MTIKMSSRVAQALTATGAALTLASPFLAWTWTAAYPGNLTLNGYPGGSQVVTLVTGLLATMFAAAAFGVPGVRRLAPAGAVRALRAASLAALTTTWVTVAAIAITLGGAVNVEPGGWLAAVAVLLLATGAHALADDTAESPPKGVRLPWAVEVALITVVFLAAMFVLTYGITTDSAEDFLAFLPAAGFGARALSVAGVTRRISEINARHRVAVAALASALVFPFTQTGDQYTAIADNILVFAAVALGLNIVVGLVGLLDLGYVAFLGTGAYSAALVSGSTFSTFHIAPWPFWATALLGMGVSLLAGLIIGAPTLRLHGDYLAIVTLGFGEIFRITVNNLDGTSGPSLTNGPNGINAIPDIELFGFDFGAPHTILGVSFGRFANYYLLLLAVIAVIVFVYARAGDSRVGRAWIALREDEKAATAMGIEGFRFKLLAFGLGASLAGLAGTVMAHLQTNAVPDNYKFADTAPPNSAFLLAAVVLGGMGTISGPLVGAALLYLIPAKFEFFNRYQMMLFGLALIVMMRFRPEGLVPDRKHQLEFHDEQVSGAEARQVAAEATV
ncbi:branched-chain amino acid ABC transporter permease [Streptomyces olivochromogenes]|uniref:Branched-chain amino acid ABC transporter permease n=1 Tax=Streptomyces olivochromogenes TaxID=1963 RepID=A0A250VRT0_STROL|nr:branched-chain amino acid ABC transporter permease [Streptomyces olivochromogenes]KUN40824.1 branched-chain amino acid ABC transporter permease [Streptomyces olivochromogenes]GAX56923.1 branched-chain amino acid ABC transporter permease [Streptomyces olivochromogenes]